MRTMCGCSIIALSLVVTECRSECLELSAVDGLVPIPSGSTTSHTTTLRLTNTSPHPAEVVVWQIGLSVVPDASAVGSVEIASSFTPDDYLLDTLSPFGPLPSFDTPLPGVVGRFSDAAFGSPLGGIIAPGETRNLLQLTLAFSPGAAGTFSVVLHPFANGFMDSSWGASGFGEPIPFCDGSQVTTLFTLSLNAVPEPTSAQLCGGILLASAWVSFRRDASKL
jgi:hypothetical protein